MRSDAIPVRPLDSQAILTPVALAEIFGKGARLTPASTVEVVQRGACLGHVTVEAGTSVSLTLDATRAPADGPVSLRGPVGAIGGVQAVTARSRLVIPDGLRRAWGLGDAATLGLGPLALLLPVETGPEVAAEVEQAIWLGAGRPDAARWLPGVALEPSPTADRAEEAGRIEHRVVTENDVRQARRQRRRIRIRPGQIVTPAARSLGREWDVLEDEQS